MKNAYRDNALVEKYNVSLKTLLQEGISEPEFYGNLVYRFRKIVGKQIFRDVLGKISYFIMKISGMCSH